MDIDQILAFAARFEKQAGLYEEEGHLDPLDFDQSYAKDKSKKKDKKKKGKKWKKMPKGWSSKSRKSYYESIGGFDDCMTKMKKKMDEPGAFCASLKDRVKGRGWRKKKRKKNKK